MKKTMLFSLFILSTIQLTISQKINLSYKVKSDDSLYVFKDKAFSDRKIQIKADKLFSENILLKNIMSIEDNINRRFDKREFNHNSYYLKLLSEGYFNLYQLEVNNKPAYIIYSKSDTLILEKNDAMVNQGIKKDRRYNGKLVHLCKDYPDLWERAGKVNFKKDDLSSLISALNDKYGDNIIRKQEKNRFDYLGISLKGLVDKDKTDIILDVLMSHYLLSLSPDLSFRYGLRANYLHQTVFVPELFSGWYMAGPDGIFKEVFIYRDHYETETAKIFEIPLSVNYEITNSIITPYIYGGLSPTLLFSKITRTDSDKINDIGVITLNAFAAAGFKLKLTNNFNILAEQKFSTIRGMHFELGIEYFLKL